MRLTASTLSKLEDIIKQNGYTIRYEKGSFTPGYCVLESKKVIVVNKYYSIESKINSLIDLINQLSIDTSIFNDKQLNFFQELTK